MSLHSRVLWWGGACGAVLLPFAAPWLSPVYGLAVLALAVLFTGKLRFRPTDTLLFVAFLLWEIITVPSGIGAPLGWSDVVMILPIGVMGLLLSNVGIERGRAVQRQWSETFAWAVVVSWSIIFVSSIVQFGWVNYKSFDLGGRLGIHFQSLYLIFAALILERKVWGPPRRAAWIRAAAVLWLLFGVVVLSARIHLILVPLLIVGRFAELIWTQKAYRKKLSVVAGVVLVIMGTLVAVLPGPRGRLVDLRNELRSVEQKVDGKQTNHRVFLWKYGVELALEKPWKGHGNGQTEDLLNEQLQECEATFYRGEEPYFLHEFKYDVHNIWLQSWIEGGVPGVLLLGVLLGWGIYHSWGAVRYGWVLFALSGSTESLLEKQAGVFFLVFLVALTLVARRR